MRCEPSRKVDSTSYTQETIGWKRERYELFGEANAAFVDSGRGIRIFVAEKIVVAVAVGGPAVLDRNIVCPCAAFLRCAVDVSTLVSAAGAGVFQKTI